MELERRTVLQLSGVVAVGGLVAACGSSSSASGAASAPGGGGSAAAGGSSIKSSDVPVGGGVVIADPAVVVTQPKAGEFKAFSSICTHQGCAVSDVSNNEIICPCHGSKFSGTDGSVINGPATAPLPAAKVTLEGGNLVVSA
jgi:Rieske Fe-S protein